jgi:hypothetical protein
MLEYLHKVKTSGLAPNQKIHAIKTFIIPKLHYASANNIIKITDLKIVDHEIRKVINYITKSQPLPLHYIYASYKDGGLGLAKCEDEYHTYKIHHIAHLMKTEHGRRILKGYGKLIDNQRLPAFQLLYPAVKNALAKLDLKWIEFDKFLESDKHSYKPCLGVNAKGNPTCNFIDQKPKHRYEALLKKVNTSCTRKKTKTLQTRTLLTNRYKRPCSHGHER